MENVIPLRRLPMKAEAELDHEFRLALGTFASRWPDCGVEDMRRVVNAYDRWRAVFLAGAN